ncbi:MAG: ATP-binding protein [Lachnospirales bacterium]
MSFDKKILGNENLIKNMQTLAENQTFSHSYIIEGIRGSGKSLLSDFFAKAILCEGENKPCGTCLSCISFDTENNPDFFKFKRDKQSFGIDIIRDNFSQVLNIKPFRSKYKVVIIEEADTLTVQAQNAILKSIEEPPSYMVFILIAESSKFLLPTIVSRCSCLCTEPLSLDLIKDEIYKKNIDDDIDKEYLSFSVAASEGSLGRCLFFLQDEEFRHTRKKVLDFLQNIGNMHIVDVIKKADEFAKEKIDCIKIYDILIMWFRDLVVYKTTGSLKGCYNIDKIEILHIKALEYTLEKLYKNINNVNTFKANYESNGNLTMNLEVLFMKLREK